MSVHKIAVDLLSKNEEFAFATIIEDSGSTPRSKGAKMIVKNDGRIYGTVGGGSMEADCISKSIECINNKESIVYDFNLSNNDAAKSDMICGGKGKISIDYIDYKDSINIKFFENELEKESNANGKAYIFGAGHVSKYVAEVLDMLEFETIVIDDREEFANKERFTKTKVVVLDSLEDLSSIEVCENSYILIITRGHMHDSNVLEWALQTNAYYIGMIGSKRKAKLTYDKLLEKGLRSEALDKVHCPIGIKLKAQTPAEIAISIGAELINCRAEKINA